MFRPLLNVTSLMTSVLRTENDFKDLIRNHTPHLIKDILWKSYYKIYATLAESSPDHCKSNPVPEPTPEFISQIKNKNPDALAALKKAHGNVIDLNSVVTPRNKNEIFLVHFNHGQNPQHMEDFFKFFWLGIVDSGRTCSFSNKIQVGATNILIEHFHDKHLPSIVLAHALGSRYIVGCNECITGTTFNGYIDPKIKMTTSAYENHRYFKVRFDRFDLVSKYFDQIWLSAEHQMPAYQERYGKSKVEFIPYGYVNGYGFGRDIKPPESRMFDCLFSGAMTQHRQHTIDKLRDAGLRVLALANTGSPEYIRMNYFWNAKVILHLKQNKNWRNPSTLRSAHTISNLGYMVAEKCELASELDSFIDVVETDKLVSHIKHVIDNKLYLTEPPKRIEQYRNKFSAHPFIDAALKKLAI
jgi:hypothetical protein